MADWVGWHARYDDPDSTQSRRLVVVRRRVGEALDALGSVSRVLSLCAGDGRDLLPELAARPRLAPDVLLVERDETLAGQARSAAAALGVGRVDVRAADAARPAFVRRRPARRPAAPLRDLRQRGRTRTSGARWPPSRSCWLPTAS